MLLAHEHNSYANVCHPYVIRTLPILFILQEVIFQEVIPLELCLLEIKKLNMILALYLAQLQAGFSSLRQKFSYGLVNTEFLLSKVAVNGFSLRFSRVRITLPFLHNFQPYIICFNMLFICDIPIVGLGVLSSNVVTFLVCLPRVYLANATVLMTTATTQIANSTVSLEFKEIAHNVKSVSYYYNLKIRIVQFFKRNSYARQLVRYYAHHILTYHV